MRETRQTQIVGVYATPLQQASRIGARHALANIAWRGGGVLERRLGNTRWFEFDFTAHAAPS
jgi:hypothetical protein